MISRIFSYQLLPLRSLFIPLPLPPLLPLLLPLPPLRPLLLLSPTPPPLTLLPPPPPPPLLLSLPLHGRLAISVDWTALGEEEKEGEVEEEE